MRKQIFILITLTLVLNCVNSKDLSIKKELSRILDNNIMSQIDIENSTIHDGMHPSHMLSGYKLTEDGVRLKISQAPTGDIVAQITSLYIAYNSIQTVYVKPRSDGNGNKVVIELADLK